MKKRESTFDRLEREHGTKRRKEADDNNWLMTYGDMMTILLVFFVLLVAISEINPVKLQQITASLRNAMGTVEEHIPTLQEVEDDLISSIEEMDMQGVVNVLRDKDGVKLMIKGESFFPSGRANLYPSTSKFLSKIGVTIQESPYKVAIEGHTDNIPIHTAQFPSNWELSGARAAAVVRYFEESGLPRSRFRIAGFADTQPVNRTLANSTPAARALNRRIVISFLNEYVDRPENSVIE